LSQIPHESVSAWKLSLLDSRKAPELIAEFAKQRSQKRETRQIFNSWRREPDSNHKYGGPYLYKKSVELS